MKRFELGYFGLIVMALLISPSISAQGERPVLKLDVEKAVGIALSNNPTIIVADKEIVRKDYTRKETLAQLYPQIDASGQYSRTLKKQVMYMDMDAGGASGGGTDEPETGDDGSGSLGGLGGFDMSKGMKVGRSNNWNAGFNAQMPVIAPALWKSIQMTKVDIEKAMEAARGSRYNLVNQVEKAYYGILNAQDSYNVLKQSYENAQLNASNYKNKFDHGTATEYEVIRAQVQVRNLEPSLLQAENAIRLAKLQLKVLLGLDLEVEIETETTLADYENDLYARALVDTSLQNNTSLKAFDLDMAYARMGLKAQQAQYYPTLSLTANYTWTSMNNDFKFKDYRWNPYSVVGVAVSVPLFQGGARIYKMKEARLNLVELKYQRDDLVRNLKTQVQMCQDNIAKSVKQIDSNKEGVEEAEKAYSIMQKSFEIGSATFVELNDADLALTSARLAYYQAIYDYLTAKSELDLVLCNKNLNVYNHK